MLKFIICSFSISVYRHFINIYHSHWFNSIFLGHCYRIRDARECHGEERSKLTFKRTVVPLVFLLCEVATIRSQKRNTKLIVIVVYPLESISLIIITSSCQCNRIRVCLPIFNLLLENARFGPESVVNNSIPIP